jgi:hypothetical protein
VPRPFRLPTFAKWIALVVFVAWMAIYFFGGWNSPKIILADPHQGPGLYLLGLLIVALYAPLYWWRAWQDRRRAAAAPPAPAVAVAADGTITGATGTTGITGATGLAGATGDPVPGAEPSTNEPPAAR